MDLLFERVVGETMGQMAHQHCVGRRGMVAGQEREIFADADAVDIGGARTELAGDLGGSVGFHVEGVVDRRDDGRVKRSMRRWFFKCGVFGAFQLEMSLG